MVCLFNRGYELYLRMCVIISLTCDFKICCDAGIVKFIGKSGRFALTSNRLYNGIWGYKKGRREYALQCNSIGLNILDVTDKPASGSTYPVIQTITMSGGDTWRDVATRGDYGKYNICAGL